MKKLISAVILMAITWSTLAQKTILRKNSKGVLESIEFSADDKRVIIPTSAETFFKSILKVKPTDEFRKIQHRQKQKEFIHEHFEQYYNGIKIDGAGYNFHYKNGKMYFAHGHYVDASDVSPKPSITGHEAMKHFAKYKNIPEKAIYNYIAELIIKEILEKTDTLPALVYRVYLYADYPQNTEVGFIDAHTGSLRMTEPVFIDFSAQGTFATRYSGSQQGTTHNYQGSYHLVDSTRNTIIHTWNLEGRTNILSRVDITDNDNNWTQAEHRPNNNDMGLDVQWALQRICDRLYNTHNINSMDDDGFTIDAHIRYSNNYDNAFWNSIDRTLSFGEGGSDFQPLASVDVVAHEFGHGITHFQIGWNNTTDQRAFNEGMSDIWGVIMEHRIHPNSVWQIGEQITRNYSCLRNLQNTNASNAMSQIANTYASPQYNSGDSYVRGGVFSHWFYLLVNGGTGVNTLGRNYSVWGIGMDNAENLIVKAVFGGYLRFTTSYAQIRTSMINAAREIAGTNSFLEHQIENAWYAVGVGNTQYQPHLSGPASVCDQATYTIENLPAGAIVQWSLSNNNAIILSSTTDKVTLKRRNTGDVELRANIRINSNPLNINRNIWLFDPILEASVYDNGIGWHNADMSYGQIGLNLYQVTPNRDIHFRINNAPLINIPISNWEWVNYNPNIVSVSHQGGYIAHLTPLREGRARINVRVKQQGCYTNSIALSIEVTSRSHFTLSPNPATDAVTLQLTETDEVSGLSVLSTERSAYEIQIWSGMTMLRSFRTNEPTFSIPTVGLPAGLYFVHVVKNGQTYTQKLIKK